MKLYLKDNHDLICDMADGTRAFRVGWVQNSNEHHYYCMCLWMSDLAADSYKRPWLSPPTYPEGYVFRTEAEAIQELTATATVAVIGGFRGRK